MSILLVLQTPVTSAPIAFAICTAKVPTPPEAPMISTFSPAWTRPWSRTACRAVDPETGTAAACSNERFVGFGASLAGRTAAYSAKVLVPIPYTSSPGAKPVTSAPRASTVPARFRPGLANFGRRKPNPASRMG